MVDDLDLRVLALYQTSTRRTLREIAARTGVSLSTVSERLQRLRSEGVVASEPAVLDRAAIGLPILAFIRIVMSAPEVERTSVADLCAMAEILECHCITGEYSYLLKVCCCSTHALEGLITRIKSVPGVDRCETMISLSAVKESTNLPIASARETGQASFADDEQRPPSPPEERPSGSAHPPRHPEGHSR